MDSIYQIAAWALSGTTVAGIVTSAWFYSHTKRAKEAETKLKEAEAEMANVAVEKAKIEARRNEIDLLYAQLERAHEACAQKDRRLSELNDAIDKHIDRRRELADKLNGAEQEINRVNRELINTKDEVIRLTDKSDRLEALKCLRADCRDPRGPKPPRKNQGTAEQK